MTSRGKTERAYATLHPNYATDASIQQLDIAGINLWWAEEGVNKAPVVRVEGDADRHVKIGEPLTLVASATDDRVPPATSSFLIKNRPAAATPRFVLGRTSAPPLRKSPASSTVSTGG